MKKFIIIGFTACGFLVACVPQRKYQDLEAKYNEAYEKNKLCNDKLAQYKSENDELNNRNLIQEKAIARLTADSTETHTLYEKYRKLYGDLSETYEKLLKNKDIETGKLMSDLKEMEEILTAREKDLNNKEARLKEQESFNIELSKNLDSIMLDLKKQQATIKELQGVLNSKDSAVKAIKDNLTKALGAYKNSGLTVEMKNGKVYVSIDEKLLFASGSIVVDKKGEEALLEFAKAINSTPDVNLMVEGHTDDVPMKSSIIKDNWDLSVLRATSVLRILTEKGKVDPKRIIASGRGEHAPLIAEKTSEARAKNRRTEIIITPKLDELLKILEN